MIKIEANAAQAIRVFLAEKGFQKPIRIDLQFSGCCDPSLRLSLDTFHESDLIQELEGLTFVITPDTFQLVGEVTISYVNNIKGKGFILTSSKPVSEWEGFSISTIRV